MTTLTNEELTRYARHIILPEVGRDGQQKLKDASVLLVGVGGLGSPVALYLAAAGIGRIGLVDFDDVDASNLQRQVLHGTSTVGQAKVESARARLNDLNPNITIECHPEALTSDNALALLAKYDIVVDGADNFPTRYLVNDACVMLAKPNVHASIARFEGSVTVYDARRGPCYRCLFPEPPPPGSVPSCADGGVLGVLPGTMGTLQATEVLKLILGIGESLCGRVLTYDALASSFRVFNAKKDPECAICGAQPSITELVDYDAFCGVPAARGTSTSDATENAWHEISPQSAQESINRGAARLLDVREPHEWELTRLEGATLIPLASLPERVNELDQRTPWVVYCHHGVRSQHACEVLLAAGFEQVQNLTGGIDRWSVEVDGSVPRY